MNPGADITDDAWQDWILPQVSRTFALTIPQLPERLRSPVANAYLLCRIADTIEDEPALDADASLEMLQRFVAVVQGRAAPEHLSRDLLPQLSVQTLPAERELIAGIGRVIRIHAGLPPPQRLPIQQCVADMCEGMHRFQRAASVRGLPAMRDLDAYCYFVAGVVGVMLTELFCDYAADIARHREALHERALAFGQGLQMTNILKDVWEDRARGACWLPQDLFARHGVDLAQLSAACPGPHFDAAMQELIGVAHAHLRSALDYTLLIPPQQEGIRRFCLWAIGLAILTLRKIARTPGFTAGSQVKVTRSAVSMTVALTGLALRRDGLLRFLFNRAAEGLPLASVPALRRPSLPEPCDGRDAVSAPAAASGGAR
jgi:farnesyl-diphosphate farnesyltransferase